jgi:hypothetical protein
LPAQVPLAAQVPTIYDQPPPRPAPRQSLSREEWKQRIIDEGQKYCDRYQDDPICHWRDR